MDLWLIIKFCRNYMSNKKYLIFLLQVNGYKNHPSKYALAYR